MEVASLQISTIFVFLLGGTVAGFIDSIVGGGGLITLPLLSIVLGSGVPAVATNKIGAALTALVALLIYRRNGHFQAREAAAFAISVAVGSFIGSCISPFLPADYLRWALIFVCPFLLYLIWRKDDWIGFSTNQKPETNERTTPFFFSLVFAGIVCGTYDGAFGPGAGTFMLLALLYFARLPLFSSIAASKLANTLSGLTSLVSYASHGYVHWSIGALLAGSMVGGAIVGASFNLRNASKIVRPLLVFAVLLLLCRLLWDALDISMAKKIVFSRSNFSNKVSLVR